MSLKKKTERERTGDQNRVLLRNLIEEEQNQNGPNEMTYQRENKDNNIII